MNNKSVVNKVWVENFKAYKEKTTLPLSALTTLIGYNGSGKTSVILGLHLLSFTAGGRALTTDSLRRNTKKFDLSYGTNYLSHVDNKNTFQIGCSIDTDSPWCNLAITFRTSNDGLRIIEEQIFNKTGDYLYQARKKNDQQLIVQISYPNPAELVLDNQYGVFAQLTKSEKFNSANLASYQKLIAVTKEFRKALSEIQFFYANLLDWNLSSYARLKILKEDGSNLASVLFHLCEERHLKDKILEFIRETPSDSSVDLRFEKINNKIRIEQNTIPYFSEGQLRLLAIAATLYSSTEGSLLVFDDVDASIDVIRAQKLIKNIYRIGRNRNLQILLTSHNPALLDALPVNTISDVVFCYRKTDHASSLIQLDQLETYPELISQGLLGNLMTSGSIKRYVEERKTKEQIKNESLKWLDDFEKGSDSK